MTDRDLFYCGGFNCDGHARSNERCEPDLYERTTEAVYGARHREDCGNLRGAVCECFLTKKPAPKYTVSGNRARLFRLDPEGNPIGEAIEFPGPVSFDIPEGSVSDATVLMDSDGLSSMTLDIDMGYVDPAILALLTGYGAPPEEVEVFMPRPWYWRWLPRRVRHWIKGREVRRGYGG